MITRFARWRALEAKVDAGGVLMAEQNALRCGDHYLAEQFRREFMEHMRRAERWMRIADWRRELRALLFDDAEHDS